MQSSLNLNVIGDVSLTHSTESDISSVFNSTEDNVVLEDNANVVDSSATNTSRNVISFEIIPVKDNENKSPIFYEKNSLGLASWCIQPLYCYVYNRLIDLRQNLHQREEPEVIARWLLGALLLNPDVSTFWNMRRGLLRSSKIDPIKELQFIDVILYFKAKCFEAFSYRRSVLQFILINDRGSTYNVETILRNEFYITSLAAERYKNNSHAWSHREYIIRMFELKCTKEIDILLTEEWEESTKWCNNHVSDYSGFAYRQFLLKKLLLRAQCPEQSEYFHKICKRREIIYEFVKNTIKDCCDALSDKSDEEVLNRLHGVISIKSSEITFKQTLINLSYWVEDCIINEDLLNAFPGHESLWYHRRFLVFLFITLSNSYANYFTYRVEDSKLFDITKVYNKINKHSESTIITENTYHSLLSMAFRLRNKDIMFAAKQYENYSNDLAEKFSNFLICMKFEV
ncbi:protein prenyltransferase alpha subunit repeat-containing protein 1 isoform X1 [Nasonia vitripennis]|uniref:Protein prenyltransferase alpha subunit repeat-containing protein 1 n=1 Tax=Nasonia vitripennis TaxID=7425 RepID=A0A7M7Q304_NASVI|nr:protein prenyltransferase alpha subunit repeat-containing protein 1 isoform X1 [Nasonia vitripennis]